MIRRGAHAGPNFAGSFTLVIWGCGAGCVQAAIVDAATGAVTMPPELKDFGIPVGYDFGSAKPGLDFQKNSSLLIATGAIDEADTVATYYYAWRNGKLVLLKSIERPPSSNP